MFWRCFAPGVMVVVVLAIMVVVLKRVVVVLDRGVLAIVVVQGLGTLKLDGAVDLGYLFSTK